MTNWPLMGELGYGYHVYQTRLREAEHERLIRSLPRPAVRPLWARVMGFVAGKVNHKPAMLRGMKA